MKKTKKISQFAAVSSLAFVLAFTPFMGSAHEVNEAEDDNDNEGNIKTKVEQRFEAKASSSIEKSDNNSIWNRIFAGLFADNSVSAEAEVDPAISDLSIEVKDHKAKVEWMTDVRSSSAVWISTTSPVDISEEPDMYRRGKVLKHKMNINDLEANTKYYIVVGSSTNNGSDITTSAETSFTTSVENEDSDSRPVITALVGDKTVEKGDQVTISVSAYDPENKPLSYSVLWGDETWLERITAKSTFVNTATFTHTYDDAGTYKATFTVKNSEGEKVSSSVNIIVSEN